MSKRNLESKLKTRLGEWRAYGDQPLPPQELPREHSVRIESAVLDDELSESRDVIPLRKTRREEPRIKMEPLQAEEKIAALQAALEHERDQARRLMDVVSRQKMLHAVSLKSQTEDRFAPAPSGPSAAWKPGRPRETQIIIPKTSRPTTLFILVALVSLLGCAYLAYPWIKLFLPLH